MILACPSCPARYTMEDGALGAQGRKVRCAACGHAWYAGPDGEPADPPKVEAPKPAGPTRADIERARRAEARPHDQMRARIQASKQKAANAAATRAWIGAAVLCVAALAGGISFRQSIVESFPKAASAYAMAGLKVNAYGLDYFNVKAARGYQGETPVLKVRGEVRNISKRARAAPDVRIAIRDKKGKEIQAWNAEVDALIIGPGEAAPFASYLANPPSSGYDIAISFAMDSGAAKKPAKQHGGKESGHSPLTDQIASEHPPKDAISDPHGADPHEAAPAPDSGGHGAPHGDDHHG